MIDTLLQIIGVFARLSLAAFGGGIPILAEMERQSTGHGWVTHREFLDIFALGQFTPGPGMLMVVVIGYRAAGLLGALAAGLAMFLPTSLLTWVVAERWSRIRTLPAVAALREAIAAVGVGLMAAGTYSLARIGVDGLLTGAIALVVLLLILSRRASPALVMLSSGVAGWLLFR